MRWIRRTVASIAVVALVALVPMVNAPSASAVTPVAPVIPSPLLPSTTGAVFSAAGGVGNKVMTQGLQIALVLRQQIAKAAANGVSLPTINKTSPAPVPIAGSASWAAKLGAGANVAGIGWLAIGATGGAVSVVGNMVGADFDQSMCKGEPWLQQGYSVLTMGMGPSCKAPVVNPNDGAIPGYTGEGYGLIILRSGTFYSSGVPGVRVTMPIGKTATTTRTVAFLLNDGNWCRGSIWSPTGEDWAASGTNRCYQHVATPTSICVSSGKSFASGTREQMCMASADGQYSIVKPTITTGNPQRSASCTAHWPDGSNTSAHIANYTDVDGFPLGNIDAACTESLVSKPGGGPGLLPERITIGTRNNETGEVSELINQPVPEFTPSETIGLTPGNGRGLELVKTVDGKEDSCMTWAADCADWWETTQQGTTPGQYRCFFGGKLVDLTECGIYRHTFDTKTDKPTITDPDTGEQTQWPTQEDPMNSTNPGSLITPGEQCLQSWPSAMNPISWVLHPVKCALVWAFAPRPQVVQQTFTTATQKWGTTMPGQIAQIASSAFVVPNVQGCEGLNIHIPLAHLFDGWVDVNWNVLNACEEPGAAAAQWSRLIASAILIYMTALGIVRRVSATVNAPGIGAGAA